MKTERPGDNPGRSVSMIGRIELSEELLKILQAASDIAQWIVGRVLLDDEPFSSCCSRCRDHARPVDDSLADHGVAWRILRHANLSREESANGPRTG